MGQLSSFRVPGMDCIVVLDFDWTLINCNSDPWVVEHMGASDLMRSLYETLPWTDLMDRMMSEILSGGRSLSEIENSLRMIPLDSSMVRAIKTVAAAGCELQIISDANAFFIKTVLENFNIARYFSQIHTNPAEVDGLKNVLRIRPYQPLEQPHCCPLCPLNMCKGLIIDNVIKTKVAKKVVYVGDGRGDICPSLRLGEDDYVLARQSFPLAKYMEENPGVLKAQMHVWSSPKEVESHLMTILNLK